MIIVWLIFAIKQLIRKFLEFSKLEIFEVFQIRNFLSVSHLKFLEMFQLQIFGILQI